MENELYTASEKIIMLLDGELNAEQETSLFAELAHNDELKNEFDQLIAIREAVKSDTEAFVPPVEATNAVFASVGFSTASLQYSNQKTESKTAIWLKRLAFVLPALALVSFVTYYLTISNINIENNTKTEQNNDSKINHITVNKDFSNPKEINTEKTNIPTVTSTELTKTSSVSKHKNTSLRYFKKESANKQDLPSFIEPVNNSNKPLTTALLTSNVSTPVDNFNIQLQRSNTLTPEFRNTRSFSAFKNYDADNYKYTVSLRGITAQSFPDVEKIVQSQESLLLNFSLGAFVKLSESSNLSFGFEFGRERFNQKFEITQPNGPWVSEQKPLIFWTGLTGKYEFEKVDFLRGGQPYVQLMLGGTDMGPIGKGIIGVQYITESGIGASLGIEGTTLYYKEEGKNYSSQKLGITYGMFVNF